MPDSRDPATTLAPAPTAAGSLFGSSDLPTRFREDPEYKTYRALKTKVLSRFLDRLPYMRRWNDFRRRNGTLVQPALEIFAEMRASGRTVRPRVIARLDGTGIDADTLLRLLSEAKLLTVRRGRKGGVYYPAQ